MRTGSGKTSGHGFQDLTQSDFHPWKIGETGSATLIDPEPAALREDLREDGYVQNLLLQIETKLNGSLCVRSDQRNS